jgi:hypothetical protein
MILVLCKYRRRNGARVFCDERNGSCLLEAGFSFYGRLVRRFAGHMAGMGEKKCTKMFRGKT